MQGSLTNRAWVRVSGMVGAIGSTRQQQKHSARGDRRSVQESKTADLQRKLLCPQAQTGQSRQAEGPVRVEIRKGKRHNGRRLLQ